MRVTALALIVCSFFARPAAGFVCLRTQSGACLHWAEGGTILRSFLGPADSQLINGTLTWDQNAFNAANDWNSVGSAFRFRIVFGGQMADPCACPSGGPAGDNPVIFSTSACGGGFGDIVAETQSCFDRQSGAVITSAVFMNQNAPWNAYDGPVRFPVNDIRRVLLHEFGHVLGLAHPNDYGQLVTAIMNSRESDLDRLADDDVSGIFSLYPSMPGTGGSSDGNSCQLAPPGGAKVAWLLWFPAAMFILRARGRRARR